MKTREISFGFTGFRLHLFFIGFNFGHLDFQGVHGRERKELAFFFFFKIVFEDDDDTDIGYSINKILKNLAILYCPT